MKTVPNKNQSNKLHEAKIKLGVLVLFFICIIFIGIYITNMQSGISVIKTQWTNWLLAVKSLCTCYHVLIHDRRPHYSGFVEIYHFSSKLDWFSPNFKNNYLKMEEDQVEQDPNVVNFIPCISFVKRGVAKENPDKVCICLHWFHLNFSKKIHFQGKYKYLHGPFLNF